MSVKEDTEIARRRAATIESRVATALLPVLPHSSFMDLFLRGLQRENQKLLGNRLL